MLKSLTAMSDCPRTCSLPVCGTRSRTLRGCSCGLVWYCNRTCQRNHWHIHKAEHQDWVAQRDRLTHIVTATLTPNTTVTVNEPDDGHRDEMMSILWEAMSDRERSRFRGPDDPNFHAWHAAYTSYWFDPVDADQLEREREQSQS